MSWLNEALMEMLNQKYKLTNEETEGLNKDIQEFEKYCDSLDLEASTRLHILAYAERYFDSLPPNTKPQNIPRLLLGSAIVAAKVQMGYDQDEPTMAQFAFKATHLNISNTKDIAVIEREFLNQVQYKLQFNDDLLAELILQYFNSSALKDLRIDLIKERVLQNYSDDFLIKLEKIFDLNKAGSIKDIKTKFNLYLADYIKQFPPKHWATLIESLRFDSEQDQIRFFTALISLHKPEERDDLIKNYNLVHYIQTHIKSIPLQRALFQELCAIAPSSFEADTTKNNPALLYLTSNQFLQHFIKTFTSPYHFIAFLEQQKLASTLSKEQIQIIFSDIPKIYHASLYRILPREKCFTSLQDVIDMLQTNLNPQEKAAYLGELVFQNPITQQNALTQLIPTEFTEDTLTSIHTQIHDIMQKAYEFKIPNAHIKENDYQALFSTLLPNFNRLVSILAYSRNDRIESIMKDAIPTGVWKNLLLTENKDVREAINSLDKYRDMFKDNPKAYMYFLLNLTRVYKSERSKEPRQITKFLFLSVGDTKEEKMKASDELIEAIERGQPVDINFKGVKSGDLGKIATEYNAYLAAHAAELSSSPGKRF